MTQDQSEELPAVFESTDVERLVDISSIRLNKFVEDNLYRLRPSIKAGKGRGSRRLFNREDVFGIALVWWLFEAGLRSNVIRVVLDEISQKKAGANQAAEMLLGKKIQVVRIQVQPRRMHRGVKMPRYLVFPITEEKSNVVRPVSIALEIPVGHLYSMLLDKMKKLTGIPEGN